MFLIGLWRSGSVCLRLFTLTLFANFPSTAPMSFLLTSSEVLHPGSFLHLSPFLQKGGMPLDGLGMPLCCFPRVFLSSRSTWSSGRGGGASGRAFGARELASVSSVHSWTEDPGVALLRRTPATFFCPGWLSLLLSARSAR